MTDHRLLHPRSDVRHHGFAQLTNVEQVLTWLDEQGETLGTEWVSLTEATGRTLAHEVVSAVDVPLFRRAMMDGFAVHADDTNVDSGSEPRLLQMIGQIFPGQECSIQISRGQAFQIATGAAVPHSCNAVIPVEEVEIHGESIVPLKPIAPDKHVGRIGEDIASGDSVLPAGRRLRPQDVGVLASIGLAQAPVVRKPRVRLVTTGNELLPAGRQPQGLRTVDSNSPMLQGLVERDGGDIVSGQIISDQPNAILSALQQECDVVLVSGGSSVGQQDYAPRLLAEHGDLPVHGINMRPARPTGIGRLNNHWVFLLPGNPVACLAAYDFFAGRMIRRMAGHNPDWPYPSCRLPMACDLASVPGRVDYARVRIDQGHVHPIAISGASLLSSTCRADGFVVIPSDTAGVSAGTEVDVLLYDV